MSLLIYMVLEIQEYGIERGGVRDPLNQQTERRLWGSLTPPHLTNST